MSFQCPQKIIISELERPVALIAASDTTRLNRSNHNSYALNENARLAVIAAGTGEGGVGGVASRMATDIVSRKLAASRSVLRDYDPGDYQEIARKIAEIVVNANNQIFQSFHHKVGFKKMGTTLDAVILLEGYAYTAHVGNGRVYWVSDNTVTRITEDHTLATILMENHRSYESESQPFQDVLLQSLGSSEEVIVDIFRAKTEPGDALLLCTEGVWRYFHEPNDFMKVLRRGYYQAAVRLVNEALIQGSETDATSVLMIIE